MPDDVHRQHAREVRALKGERALAYADERIGYLEVMGDAESARHWRAVRACIVEEESGAAPMHAPQPSASSPPPTR